MNTTVVVALITSLSTLSGGLIGSITSVIINRSQSAKADAAKRREIRRTAYVQLLDKFDQTITLLQKCWALYPVSESEIMPNIIIETGNELKALENAVNVVQLEGPAEIP